MARKTRDWTTARKPVTIDEVTEDMLAPIRRVAEKSGLPQTVWPSQHYGGNFVGVDCLLVSMAAIWVGFQGRERPETAAKDSAPLLTVLPSYYVGEARN